MAEICKCGNHARSLSFILLCCIIKFMEKKISWERVTSFSKDVANKVRESKFKPDYLIGITVGGLIPLGLIAEELEVSNILTVSAGSYSGKVQGELKVKYLPEINLEGKKILLIDEVAETGKTLQNLSKMIREKYKPSKLCTAVLVLNKKDSQFQPDFVGFETEDWIIFPWEK